MKNRSALSTLVLGSSLLALVSCGNNGGSSSRKEIQQEQLQEIPGLYRATLTGLNTTVSGNTNGLAVINIKGDEIEAIVDVDGAPAQISHMQYVRVGTRCPDASSDTNNDGTIDLAEAEAVSGKAFLPLDSNLNSQAEGTSFPIARSTGKYHYSEAASLTAMLSDLYAPDENLDDAIVKFEARDDLNMSGRVVMIHGASGSATLPIACGILNRVENSDEVSTTGGKE